MIPYPFPAGRLLLVLASAVSCLAAPPPEPLTAHIRSAPDLVELRDLRAEWNEGTLRLSTDKAERYAWAVLPAPESGWDLARRATVDAKFNNPGSHPVGVDFWVVGNHGWEAVVDSAVLAPFETRTFSCDLRKTFPDQTPKLNPGDIKSLQIILNEPILPSGKTPGTPLTQARLSPRITKPLCVEVSEISARGEAPDWQRPAGRLDVPAVEDLAPAPGKRVRYRPSGDESTGIYSVLNLPQDWQPSKSYPVIVEYPGNIFLGPQCYSTGLPDQCVIGYGISKGQGAICLGLPFIDRAAGKIAENAWGNAEDTADYAVRMVEEVCTKYGGDTANIVLTGFSRGAIACGYIGLRNERIAALWKGFHACQHYDGGGWSGATMPGALERAARFRGKGVFQTDNPKEKYQPVIDAMGAEAVWADSGLGFHSTAMFLDERASTRALREWFWKLVALP
jgi:hypothetical protein